MTVSTVLILKHLVDKKRAIQPNTANFLREKQFAKSVIIMDTWILITLLPICIVYMIDAIIRFDFYNILHVFCIFLTELHASCNFLVLLYCNKL